MTVIITLPERGRGAWPLNGAGGTLMPDGRKPGRYYRSPVGRPMIGLTAFRVVRDGGTLSLNDYATYRATMAVQQQVNAQADGLWGAKTDLAVKAWQAARGLTADGVYGPVTSRAMWYPYLVKACLTIGPRAEQPTLIRLACGHASFESAWDPGAVGVLTPVDLGIAQINGPSHPGISNDERLDPLRALPWLVAFANANLQEFDGDIRAACAAYNLGQGGCRAWIKAGRPDIWTRTVNGRLVSTHVTSYIDRTLAAC